MGVQLIGVYLTGVHLIDVYFSKSKKALGKTSRSPTLQMVVDLLRVPSYLPRQPLKHQPVYLSVLPFHLRLAIVKESSNTRS